MNHARFHELLIKAIGARSQKSFAEEAGLSPAHLSRLLNGPLGVPAKETLYKIAACTQDVTAEELLAACGYMKAPETKTESLSPKERAEKYCDAIRNMLSSMVGESGVGIFNGTVEDLLSELTAFYKKDEIKIEKGNKVPYAGKDYRPADDMVPVFITWNGKDCDITAYLILYTIRAKSGKDYVTGWAMDMKSISEALGIPAVLQDRIDHGEYSEDEALSLPRYYETTFHMDPAQDKIHDPEIVERILQSIFGEYENSYPCTVFGFGFEVRGIPDGFFQFIKDHKDSWVESEEDEEALKTASEYEEEGCTDEDIEALFAYRDRIDKDGDEGWGTLIADIMTKETGITFEKYQKNLYISYPCNTDCIMCDLDAVPDEKKDSIAGIVEKYARELLVPRYGTINYTMDVIRRQAQFIRREDGTYEAVTDPDVKKEGLYKYLPARPDSDCFCRVYMADKTFRNLYYDAETDTWNGLRGPVDPDTIAGWKIEVSAKMHYSGGRKHGNGDKAPEEENNV